MSVIGDEHAAPVAEPPLRRGLSPSLRDGVALVLSNGLTSAVGLAYWVLAANDVLAEVGAGPEELRGVPQRGLLAGWLPAFAGAERHASAAR